MKLGIIGGVGSMASSYFYQMIIEHTKVNCDQEHINMVILNHATIPDRTDYILGKSEKSPLPDLKEDIMLLNKLGCNMIAIPCNTSCYFHEDMQKVSDVPVNNMVDDTVNYLNSKGIKKVYILATSGTINSKLYQNACDKYGLEYRIPNDDIQKLVMSTIYDDIKCGKNTNLDKWNKIIENLEDDEIVILGCTELSLVKRELNLGDKFCDPMLIQTEKIIKFFNKEFI